MSTLSDNTAIRRSLIESIRLTLADTEDWETMSEVDSDTYSDLAEMIADNLIDGDWVTGLPGDEWKPIVPIAPRRFDYEPLQWWQQPGYQPLHVWCVV